MQISKKHHGRLLWSKRLFCREHDAELVCEILSQLDLRNKGRGLFKIEFLDLYSLNDPNLN